MSWELFVAEPGRRGYSANAVTVNRKPFGQGYVTFSREYYDGIGSPERVDIVIDSSRNRFAIIPGNLGVKVYRRGNRKIIRPSAFIRDKITIPSEPDNIVFYAELKKIDVGGDVYKAIVVDMDNAKPIAERKPR